MGFESATNVARSNKMANVINRTKSGNPGYIFGRPVLLGSSRSTTIGLSVISPKAQGLELLGSVADGVCAASRGHTVCCWVVHSEVSPIQVNFGVNVQSGCLLKLNRSELRDFCVRAYLFVWAERASGRSRSARGWKRCAASNSDSIFTGSTIHFSCLLGGTSMCLAYWMRVLASLGMQTRLMHLSGLKLRLDPPRISLLGRNAVGLAKTPSQA